MFAAVHEGRALDVWTLGERVRARWSAADAPWRAEVWAVLATAAAIGGRSDDVGPVAADVVDDPAASAVALALADRAWGLATRAADPIAAAEHFALSRAAAARAGFGSIGREVGAFEAGELDLAGDADRARGPAGRGPRATPSDHDDVFVVVLAHLVSCRPGDARRIGRRGAPLDLTTADAVSAAIGHPWWTRRDAADGGRRRGGVWRRLGGIPAPVARGRRHRCERWSSRRGGDHPAHRGGRRPPPRFGHDAEALYAAAPRADGHHRAPGAVPRERRPRWRRHDAVVPRPLVAALDAAREVLGRDARVSRRPRAAASGELAVEGDGWRVTFDGRTVRIRDMKGIGDLAVLVGRPGVEVHALELMGGGVVEGAAGPALDERARREYQTRIVELQRDIDEARDHHDQGRAERAEVELDALVAQLSEAFGLGGRARPTGSSAERARSAVTYRVRAAIKKVGELHPELGRHLTNAVRTGTWCAYQPERDINWTVDLTV